MTEEYVPDEWEISNADPEAIPEGVEDYLQSDPFNVSCIHVGMDFVAYMYRDAITEDYYSTIWLMDDFDLPEEMRRPCPHAILRANSIVNLVKITNNTYSWE